MLSSLWSKCMAPKITPKYNFQVPFSFVNRQTNSWKYWRFLKSFRCRKFLPIWQWNTLWVICTRLKSLKKIIVRAWVFYTFLNFTFFCVNVNLSIEVHKVFGGMWQSCLLPKWQEQLLIAPFFFPSFFLQEPASLFSRVAVSPPSVTNCSSLRSDSFRRFPSYTRT